MMNNVIMLYRIIKVFKAPILGLECYDTYFGATKQAPQAR